MATSTQERQYILNTTIHFYNQNAQRFFDETVDVNMNSIQDDFLRLLPPHADVLDVGCGSGRDALYFKQQGCNVQALDASQELCELASQLLGQAVFHQQFLDIHWVNQFDGIWACASLLHCLPDELPIVLQKLNTSLKSGGYIYMSFKYGDSCREKDGRFFLDMNEALFAQHLSAMTDWDLIKQWQSSDQRNERNDIWLNIICQKA